MSDPGPAKEASLSDKEQGARDPRDKEQGTEEQNNLQQYAQGLFFVQK